MSANRPTEQPDDESILFREMTPEEIVGVAGYAALALVKACEEVGYDPHFVVNLAVAIRKKGEADATT